MSSQTPSQDLPSDWAEQVYLEAAKDGWDDLLDKADQLSNPFAEELWEMEKKKARQEQERNTRHSVDKSEDFIKSGMTLITDPESDKYLRKVKKYLSELPVKGIHAINIDVANATNFTFISQCSVSYWH